MSHLSEPTSRHGKVFILAGEPSGDLHGSLILSHLKRRIPDLHAEGVGGALMRSAGLNCLHSIDELAVIGFVEVIKNLRHFLKIFNDLKRHLRRSPPDLLILIDYPGLNVRLAEYAKSIGIRVLYYI